MTAHGRLLHFTTLFWVPNLSKLVPSCDVLSSQGMVTGAACPWDNPVNITGVTINECVLHCALDQRCNAVNYDVESDVCMRMAEPCPIIETQPHVHYQMLTVAAKDECVRWVATHDWNYQRVVKINQNVGGNYPLGVARIETTEGDILPGKWPNNDNNAFTIKSSNKFYGPHFDVLVVYEACSLRWVYYDASNGNPLPTGAIQGGHWAEGTPLYVAAIYIRDDRRVVGYYNHETQMGTCEYRGVNNEQHMDILVIVWIWRWRNDVIMIYVI